MSFKIEKNLSIEETRKYLISLSQDLTEEYFYNYCGMFAQSNNCEASIDRRCYGTALQIRPLLGNNRTVVGSDVLWAVRV
jgi:hypothetical protein